MPTAVIADDEPRLAADLAARLRTLWPQLEVLAIVTNGIAAVSAMTERQPDFAFLDVRMPGLSGIEVARITARTRVVFVTAHDEYAVAAFETAAADYLLKPVSDARLARCVSRLAEPVHSALNASAMAALFDHARPTTLQWLTVRLADTTRMVAVNEVLYFRASDKYTEAVTATEGHLIRTPLKELLEQLDPQCFAQVHRSVIVNLRAVDRIERDLLGRSMLYLRDRADVLTVSRSFLERFKQS